MRWNEIYKTEAITNEDAKANKPMLVLAFIALSLAFAFLSVRYFTNTLRYGNLEENGSYASAQIVEKINKPNGKAAPYFYLKYRYENTYADQECDVTGEFKTTPKAKACRVNIRVQLVTPSEFKAFRRGDKIEVLYLPSDEKTMSMIEGLSEGRTSNFGASLLFLLLSLLCGCVGFIFSIARTTPRWSRAR